MANVLLTGGAGYIGSHTFIELVSAGYSPVIYDNFINSKLEVVNRLQRICGETVQYVQGDIRDQALLADTLKLYGCEAVIHFAGLKAVGESVENPAIYYDNNITGTISLLAAMRSSQVKQIVFSSSATVYGQPDYLPLDENHPLSATNPYGRTKLFIEEILRDYSRAYPELRVAILRYFNPVGAHESGLIGEDPVGIPNNLMPYVAQVATGLREYLNVWGNDYDTPDGTGVRDFIHVVDLAKGHIQALAKLAEEKYFAVNLGTGKGYSVIELINAFQQASGIKIPYQVKPRREGDVAACYADPTLAKILLGWTAEKGIDEMCEDNWRWQKGNPNGY